MTWNLRHFCSFLREIEKILLVELLPLMFDLQPSSKGLNFLTPLKPGRMKAPSSSCRAKPVATNCLSKLTAASPLRFSSSINWTLPLSTSYWASFAASCYSLMRVASFSTLICCLVRLLLLSDCSRLADTPLDANTVNMVKNKVEIKKLTADGCRLPEDLRHLRVHLDHDILFHRNLFMTDFDLSFDPLRKLLLKNGGAHVGKPLLRCLRKLK